MLAGLVLRQVGLDAVDIRQQSDTRTVDSLDCLGRGRYDVSELVSRANKFERLPADQQDETTLWEYAGMDEAQHVLTALLPELHNTRIVVRGLDGALQFVFEDLGARLAGDTVWSHAELIRENLVEDDEIADRLGEADVDLEAVRGVVVGLPSDPDHTLSF